MQRNFTTPRVKVDKKYIPISYLPFSGLLKFGKYRLRYMNSTKNIPWKGHIYLKLIFHSVFLKTLYNFHHPHDGSGDWKGLRRRGEGEPGQLWQLWWLPPNPWLPIILSAGRDKLHSRLATQIFHDIFATKSTTFQRFASKLLQFLYLF